MKTQEIEKKIEKVLKKSKKPLTQVDISKKIGVNPFIVDGVLNKFERRGFVTTK